MDFKVVVSDPKTGKSYQREVKEDRAARFGALKLGDEFDAGGIGLAGYTLKITGGSDKSGFPMKKGVQGIKRAMVLMNEGVGYRPKEPVRRRKRVRGEKIAEDIVQINTMVVKQGIKSIEELFGITTEGAKEGEAKKEEAKEKK